MRPLRTLAALTLAALTANAAEDPSKLQTSPLAAAFGAPPAMWGLRLSPDGWKMSGIQVVPALPTRSASARSVGATAATPRS